MIIDKINFLEKIKSTKNITLEFGCGSKKIDSYSIGIDQLDFPCVDVVGDAIKILNSIPSNSIDKIASHHFVEHVDNFYLLISEKSRVLKKGGTIEIVVPHFSNPYFYSDYTHKTFFGLYTFSYLTDTSILKRKVPKYKEDLPLKLEKVFLNFRAEKPFYIRYIFGLLLNRAINSSNYLKEFYEINLSNLYSCHEIKFILRKF